jgi:hypothetical protein
MESVVNYLEDTEKILVKELSELFRKMREQRDSIALKGIEEMYSFIPLEGIIYDPCVRIPGPGGHYYCSEYKLPKDEYIIFSLQSSRQHISGQSYNGTTNKCIAITNYGRCFLPKQIGGDHCRGYSSYTPNNDNKIHNYQHGMSGGITPIIQLDPLPYKLPEQFVKVFNLGICIGQINNDSIHGDTHGGVHESIIKIVSDTTTSLQELNKEFYLFAGKWKPHMTEHATLDIDKMRQTIIENSDSIQDLSGKKKDLEEQNKTLQAELNELKEQKVTLEKEKAKLLPLEKYKEVVLEFMNEHYDGKNYKPTNTDSTIIELFENFHANKVFMDEWVYNDVMESKEELNEYRIYKKVKGDMVSTGMDKSNVAKNVRSIKTTIKKNNNS